MESDDNSNVDKFEHVKEVAQELYAAWENFSYGIPKKGKIENVPSAEYYDKHYRFLTPEEFEKYGGGICWDYVEWGDQFLQDKDVKFRKFYIWTETPPNWDTHTFIVLDCGEMDRYVYVESSFKLLKGVWIHNSLDEIIDTITWNMFKCNDNARRFDQFRYVVFEFTGKHPDYGCTCKQYMNWMAENAKDIKEGYAKKDQPPNGVVQEAKITTKDRNELEDSDFGLVYTDEDGKKIRKYPLTDEEHVRKAVQFFNKAPDDHKEELARNIVKRAKELDMDWENWESLKPYLPKATQESFIQESRISLQLRGTMKPSDMVDEWLDHRIPDEYKKWLDRSPTIKPFDINGVTVVKLYTAREIVNMHNLTGPIKSLSDLKRPKILEIGKTSDNGSIDMNISNKGSTISLNTNKRSVIITFKELMDAMKSSNDAYKSEKHSSLIKALDSIENKKGKLPDDYKKKLIQNKVNDIHDFFYDLEDFIKNNTKSNDIDGYYQVGDWERNQFWCGLRISDMLFGTSNDKYKTFDATSRTIEGLADFINWNERDIPEHIQESTASNGLTNARLIALRIHEQYKKDSKPPTGNQNCQVCTWCAEENFRGGTASPRPVYSPRDTVFNVNGWDIVMKPNKTPIKNKDDVIKKITLSGEGSRWYTHVKWKDGHGGHEFLLLNLDGNVYVMDAQQGFVESITSSDGSKYFDDINYKESFICRLDNKEFNHELFKKNNGPSKILPWDEKLDIPYMKKEGLLSEEDDIQDLQMESYQMEGAWQDIKNGVNPWSNKLYFHVSRDDNLDGKTLKPRVPNYLTQQEEFDRDKDPYFEETKTPRVCFSNSIEGCLNAMISAGDRVATGGDELYVYIPVKPISEYKTKLNKDLVKDKDVFDAKSTGEIWILEPVQLKLYGTIMIDQLSNHKAVNTVNKAGKVSRITYKWHWQVKPKVIKKMDVDIGYFSTDYHKNKQSNDKPVVREGYTIPESYKRIQSFLEGNYEAFDE